MLSRNKEVSLYTEKCELVEIQGK